MNCVLNVVPGFIEDGIFTAGDMEKMEPLSNQGLHDHKYLETKVFIDQQTYNRLKEYHNTNGIKSKDLYRRDNLVVAVVADGGYFIKSFMNGECKEIANEEFLDLLRDVRGVEKFGFAILIPKHMTFI